MSLPYVVINTWAHNVCVGNLSGVLVNRSNPWCLKVFVGMFLV